jgi:hypothetical protein
MHFWGCLLTHKIGSTVNKITGFYFIVLCLLNLVKKKLHVIKKKKILPLLCWSQTLIPTPSLFYSIPSKKSNKKHSLFVSLFISH